MQFTVFASLLSHARDQLDADTADEQTGCDSLFDVVRTQRWLLGSVKLVQSLYSHCVIGSWVLIHSSFGVEAMYRSFSINFVGLGHQA